MMGKQQEQYLLSFSTSVSYSGMRMLNTSPSQKRHTWGLGQWATKVQPLTKVVDDGVGCRK